MFIIVLGLVFFGIILASLAEALQVGLTSTLLNTLRIIILPCT